MMMGMDKDRQRLLTIWRNMQEVDRHAWIKFGEFLTAQADGMAEQSPVGAEPLPIPKPEQESAVQALKRLKRTYPMIEADAVLLGEAAQLVMQRVMGATDAELIPKVETLFADRYRQWRELWEAQNSPGVPVAGAID